MVFPTSRIARRIITLVFVSVLISMVGVSSIFAFTQINHTLEIRKSSIEAVALVYASAVADAVAAGKSAEAYATLRSITRVPGIVYAAAVDETGKNTATLGNAIIFGKTPDASDSFLRIIQTGFYGATVDIIKSREPAGRLVVVADVSDLRSELVQAILVIVLSALAVGFFVVVIATRLQARITTPILSLIKAMTYIRAVRDYSIKVEHIADDETGKLVDTFNGMMGDIKERDSALARLAFYDPLTHLPNRQNFQEHLVKALDDCSRRGSSAALYLLDLDEFKLVNDTLGHSIGDKLLIAVADTFVRSCPPDIVLARLGGDEFALLGHNIATESAAIDAIGRVIARLLSPFQIERHQINVTTSIGCALVPRDGQSVEELFRRADLALYSAKREGRGRFHFYKSAMTQEVKMRSALASDLQRAQARGELEAHYQAQVDLRSGKVCGFESLLR